MFNWAINLTKAVMGSVSCFYIVSSVILILLFREGADCVAIYPKKSGLASFYGCAETLFTH